MPALTLQERLSKEAYRVVYLQGVGVFLVSIGLGIGLGIHPGLSALVGGMAYILPNILLIKWIFRFIRAGQAAQFAQAFFVGEMMKVFLSALLFLMIVKMLPLSLLSTVIGFIAALVSFWAAGIWHFCARMR